jgi:hypothetical protein
MNPILGRNAPTAEGTYDIAWVLIAAVLGFALFGLLGLGIFTAVALVLSGIFDLGGV